MRKLEILIDCGEMTCASAPGVLCAFYGNTAWGTKEVCRLFPDVENSHTRLVDADGWLQRCPACLAAEPKPVSVLRRCSHPD